MAKHKVGLNSYRPVKIDGLIEDLNKVEDVPLITKHLVGFNIIKK